MRLKMGVLMEKKNRIFVVSPSHIIAAAFKLFIIRDSKLQFVSLEYELLFFKNVYMIDIDVIHPRYGY